MAEDNAVKKNDSETPAKAAASQAPAQEHDSGDWAVLGDHAQHPPSSDLNASTMLMPAPEFPAAYRTPSELLPHLTRNHDSEHPAQTPSDPNAKTMILPPIDFTASDEPALLPRPTIPELNIPASTLIIPASEMAFSPEILKEFQKTPPLPPAVLPPVITPTPPLEIKLPPAPPVIPTPEIPTVKLADTLLPTPLIPVAPEAPVTPIAPLIPPILDEPPASTVQHVPETLIAPKPEIPVFEIKAEAPAPAPAIKIEEPPPTITPTETPTPKRSGTVSLAPPPDNPFGSADSSFNEALIATTSHTFQAPAPSGANWRTVMNAIPGEQPKAVLSATGLVKWFGKRQVVRGVDLEVGAGEIIGLLGRNGAGKTTTFRMIMGLLHPDGGHVTYENRDVTRLPMYQRANRGIGYLAQNPSIFQRMSVEENLLAVLELQEPSRKVRKERMEELIESLGLEKVRKSQAAVLSGGERRRLEIARAMSLRPRIVLFDEPFAGIDPITVSEIQSILRDLKKQGVGVLITDHNVRETLTITDRTYIMDDGKIWIHGHPKEIVENEEARARYLGQDFRLDF